MSDICFVSIGNIYITPYINTYLNLVEKDFDIIYWNRDDISEKVNAKNIYIFKHSSNTKLKKIFGYIEFAKFCKQIYAMNKYKKIVFLGTITAMLNYFNIKCQNTDYFVDIRDYTFEFNKIFYYFEKKCLSKTKSIVISSPAYKNFLPPNLNYMEIHNVQNVNYKINQSERKIPIKLAYIGTITYLDENKKLINYFANDNRFELYFIGKNSNLLNEYCEKNNIRNVYFEGRFKPEDIMKYYNNTDVIINAYGNNTPKLDYALSNKLYFGTRLFLPIIVNENTYMEKLTKQLGIGLTFSKNNDLKKEIMNFTLTKEIKDNLVAFNNEVNKTNRDTINALRRMLNE